MPKECPVVLVNVRSDEAREYKRAHKNITITEAPCLSEAMEHFIPGGYVIIEDIINLAKKEERTLRKLLNFDAHHNRLRVVCIAHLLFRTSLLSLVSLYNYVAFTLNNASRALVKQAAMYSFYLEPEKSKAWVAAFTRACKTWGEYGGYAFISCKEVKIYHKDVAGSITLLESGVGEKEEPHRAGKSKVGREGPAKRDEREGGGGEKDEEYGHLIERFASYFKGHERSSTAVSIFSIVASVLAKEPSFRSFDLTFSFKQQRQPNTIKRISIVDYVDCLVDAHPLSSARRDFRVLHNYLSERCKIPLLFILNPHFRLRPVLDESSNVEDDDDDDDGGGDDDDDNDAEDDSAAATP